jgi:hypothetical protein
MHTVVDRGEGGHDIPKKSSKTKIAIKHRNRETPLHFSKITKKYGLSLLGRYSACVYICC